MNKEKIILINHTRNMISTIIDCMRENQRYFILLHLVFYILYMTKNLNSPCHILISIFLIPSLIFTIDFLYYKKIMTEYSDYMYSLMEDREMVVNEYKFGNEFSLDNIFNSTSSFFYLIPTLVMIFFIIL